MAIQTVPLMLMPRVPRESAAFANHDVLFIDASGEKAAYIIQIPKTGTLDFVGFMNGNSTFTTSTLRVSFQDVSATTGDPDETQDQFRDITSLTDDTWTETGLMTADGTDGGAKRSVTQGDILAVVFEYQSFTAGNGVAIRSFDDQSAQGFWGRYPYADLKTGGTWAKQTKAPRLALRYSDGHYYPIVGCVPGQSVSTVALNLDGTPDELGNKFTVSTKVRVAGVWATLDFDGDTDLVLYDSTDAVVASVSLDANQRTGTAIRHTQVLFASSVTLTASAVYRLVVKPTTSTNTSVGRSIMTNATSDLLEALPLGNAWMGTSRTNAGAWTDASDTRYDIGLILDGLEDGV